MKHTKRTVAWFLVLLISTTVFSTSAFASGNGNELIMEASTASGKAGDTVEVDIKITQNPGVIGFGIQVEYDDEILELTKVPTVTNIIGGSATQSRYLTDNPYSLVIFDGTGENSTATGTIMTMSFLIKEDAALGETPVTVSFKSNGTPLNFDLDLVACDTVNGKVTVQDHTWGDPVYTWDEDNNICTATARCTDCMSAVTKTDVRNTKVKKTTVEGGGTVSAYIAEFPSRFADQVKIVTEDIPKGCGIFVAGYTSGRMSNAQILDTSCSEHTFAAEKDNIKVFFLNSDWVPLQAPFIIR